jgi:hypothetical protein
MLSVLSVALRLRYPLSLGKGDQSTAGTATTSKNSLVKPYYLVTSYIS